jgi:uncharacterized protein with PQ loop repeat
MNNCTHDDTNHQEYFGWIGNAIFIIAQYAQIIHTFKVKKTDDVSYILEVMWIIGNGMYTVFGYIDNSISMFYGNLTSFILSLIQLSQKIYYDRINNENRFLLGSISSRTYSEIN